MIPMCRFALLAPQKFRFHASRSLAQMYSCGNTFYLRLYSVVQCLPCTILIKVNVKHRILNLGVKNHQSTLLSAILLHSIQNTMYSLDVNS